jgi:hypothetical protein
VESGRNYTIELRGNDEKCIAALGLQGATVNPCRECKSDISEQALTCPHCGTPYPAKDKWDGWGFEYKTQKTFLSLSLVHISFKYRSNRVPVVAKGVIAIGQFAFAYALIAQMRISFMKVMGN